MTATHPGYGRSGEKMEGKELTGSYIEYGTAWNSENLSVATEGVLFVPKIF